MKEKINGTNPPQINSDDEITFHLKYYTKEQIIEMYKDCIPNFENIHKNNLLLGEKGSELLIDEDIFKLV